MSLVLAPQCKTTILLRTGVPNLWALDPYWSRPVRIWAAQQEMNFNVIHLNHPEPFPFLPLHPQPWTMEKLSSKKWVPGAKRVEDHWLRTLNREVAPHEKAKHKQFSNSLLNYTGLNLKCEL